MFVNVFEKVLDNIFNSSNMDKIIEFEKKYDEMFGSGFTGRIGETHIEMQLQIIKMLGINGKILKNIYIPKNNGETTEIDLLFITEKGIFVIESKNYSGWIFGDEKSPQWTTHFPNGQKFQFYNPIMQNRSHIKWLCQYLNEQIPTFSLIVFSERCEIKKMEVDSYNVTVLNRPALGESINDYWQTADFCLDTEKVELLYSRLLLLANADSKIKKEHTENVNNTINKSEATCPLCNSQLVLRTATKGANTGGQFYGCSNFPKCRFTKNI